MKNFLVLGIISLTIAIGSQNLVYGNPAVPAAPRPFNDITAAQLVSNIRVGWNLGNSLEANDHGAGWMPRNADITQMETGWQNPVTTRANIDAIKNAGFNAIRIPVTWTKAASPAPDYTIRADWIARVVEVVNYAVSNDMYIILNTHHDEESVFGFLNSDAAAGQAAFRRVWQQIADTFKNYDEKLIFEGLNEPRTVGSANEWTGGTSAERRNLNTYYQIFVDTVRASGGNNDKRILMVNTYAAWHTAAAVNELALPRDTTANKLIVSFHLYVPVEFTYNFSHLNSTNRWSNTNRSDTSPITTIIDRFYNRFVRNGVPVIIGEFGSMNKNNTAARAAWTEFVARTAWNRGIKCFIWDNGLIETRVDFEGGEGHGLLNRANNTFPYQEIINALMNGTR
ncbi:MAG: glycoside hydrolase family 5 protein [Treponema sp.]|nr:glycoside hydrolase family 5 protein [Treponema sp.]